MTEKSAAIPDKPTLTVAEVAVIYGVHEKSVRKAAAAGELPGLIRLGRRMVFATAAIRRHLEGNQE